MNHSIGELKAMARKMLLVSRYPVPMLSMLIASMIPSFILYVFTNLCINRDQVIMQNIIYYCAYMIILLIEVLLTSGVLHIHLRIGRGEPVAVKDMFWVLKNRPDRFLACGFLLTLMEALPLAPGIIMLNYDAILLDEEPAMSHIILLLALIIVGTVIAIYFILCYAFTLTLLADDVNINVIEAFRMSRHMMRGQKGRYFLMELSFIGWALLGILSLGIGMLWIYPYMTQTATNFYLDCRREFDVTVSFSSRNDQTFYSDFNSNSF
ncbi:MAG: DUF975 family protein [bacterium]|nr:DUF975 family protein [bacterium]